MKKRFWTLLLSLTAVCLLLCSIGLSDTNIASGTCGAEGDNLTWTLTDTDGDGFGETLTISGSGKMADWDDPTTVPWYRYRASITTVIAENGVASIGARAFYGCSRLTNVSLGNSVTKIGSYAFNNCALTSIVLPRGVKNIEANTFRQCRQLASVSIPMSVSTVEANAFTDCDSLSTVYYSGSDQKWKKLSIASGNEDLTSANIIFDTISGGKLSTQGAEVSWSIPNNGKDDTDAPIKISVKQDVAEKATAFLVIYSEKGQMLGLKSVTLTRGESGELALDIPSAQMPKHFKLILLDSNSAPITSAMGDELPPYTTTEADNFGGDYETGRDYT